MTEALDGWGVMERAVDLSRRGESFALATVVWRLGPSSGQQGSRAIVTAAGEVFGWVGGACAEPVLVREARGVIASGESRLLWLGQPDELADVHVPDGVVAVPIACQSDGALQIFIEPAQAAPTLVVVGRSPMAATLEGLARALDWRVHLVDGKELTDELLTPTALVVVATQGHDDEDVLERVLAARPRYVGLVASKRRGDAVVGYLADRGHDAEAVASVRYPVGLDLGHTTHREVAVAILAELVALKASGALPAAAPAATTATAATTGATNAAAGTRTALPLLAAPEAIDPVCGMTVTADESGRPYEHDGTTFYFCCPGCRHAFAKAPTSFLTQEAR